MSKIIENNEDVVKLISRFHWLTGQAERLIYVDDFKDVEVTDLSFEGNDTLIIQFNYSFKTTNTCEMELAVPIEWLFLNDEELEAAKKEKLEENWEYINMKKELLEMMISGANEAHDREEYSRLKMKYEMTS
jgi:hypothetical protein